MSVLDKLASALDRRDEVPNQLLAQEIAEAEDRAGVQELIEHLADRDKAIRSDCIKVLYEVGERKPDLIAGGVNEFIALLGSRDNRLVWGAMTALGAIAHLRAADIWRQIDLIFAATERGSVITQDWGVRVLATVSGQDRAYEQRIYPFLLAFLRSCRPKDLPRHAESVVVAVNPANRAEFLAILEARKGALRPSQAKRVEQIIRKIQKA